MGERPLSAEDVGTTSAGWSGETPLWYYTLREADVLIGLLDLDPASVRHAPQSWKRSATLIELLVGP
jgi:hypothetical protein